MIHRAVGCSDNIYPILVFETKELRISAGLSTIITAILWFSKSLHPNDERAPWIMPRPHLLKSWQESLLFSSFFFFFIAWGEVRLRPVGTQATIGSTVKAPNDRWLWRREWKQKHSEKTYRSTTSSTTNPTRPYLESNKGAAGSRRLTT
jgi:hypothetical protein